MASLIDYQTILRQRDASPRIANPTPVKTVSPDVPRARVLLFGIRCQFTEIVAARLATSSDPPVALILPGPPGIEQPIHVAPRRQLLPMLSAPSPADEVSIPTYQVGRLTAPETVDLVESLHPDLIVVACFPSLIPLAMLNHAQLGGINIHPSLLPRHRGPDPLFWIMRDGGRGCGISVHSLADRYDSGDIFAQQPVPYPDGAREQQLERTLASEGAQLALGVIDGLVSGTQSRTVQDERFASYESWPEACDYVIDTRRPARDGWNFVRGVARRGVPIRVDASMVHIRDAVAFGDDSDPPDSGDGEIVIQFNPGWLLAALAEETAR
jgi:methionyl-tRNA formyltransferase